MTRRQYLSFLFSGLAMVGLSACGRRNQPEHPKGSEYPKLYPYVAPTAKTAPAVEPDTTTQKQKSDPLRLETKTGYQR